MPQRFLKPGLLTSKKWDGLSWMAQSFYIRLIPLVDDFGRYHADPTLLKSHAFPLREDIRASQVSALCKQLSGAQLAIFYKADGSDFLQLTSWSERARSDVSKFPAINDQCVQMFANVSSLTTNAAESCGILPSSSSSSSSSFDQSFDQFWTLYPRKVGKGKARECWFKLKPSKELAEKIVSSVKVQSQGSDWLKDEGRFIPHPSTWLNQERWEDEVRGGVKDYSAGTGAFAQEDAQ